MRRIWRRSSHLLVVTSVVLGLLSGMFVAPVTSAGAATRTTASVAAAASASTGAAPGVVGSVARLYEATFDRAPDQAGLEYWVILYLRGLPLDGIAQQFVTSQEWQARYGPVDDARFVDLLYRNVLGRPAEPAGRSYWIGQLQAGVSRVAVLLGFSEGPELVKVTGTAAPQAPPPIPWPAAPANSGLGRRVIYDNDAQRVWWIDEYELIVNSYLVSGRRATPGPGTYRVFSKSSLAYAGHDGITMRWMVRFAHGSDLAIGFHAIPRYANGTPLQSESQLGTYRSAGCVRQADHQAQALFEWADVGTTVVVLP